MEFLLFDAPLGFLLLFFVFGVGGTIFWIWTIVDCATKEPSGSDNKVIWILIILLASWIGALSYFLVRRPQRIREHGQ